MRRHHLPRRGGVRSGPAGWIAAAISLLVVSSCGIPQDDKPQPIAREALPAAVVEPASTTTEPRPASATRPATLFLVRESSTSSDPETLEPVTASIPVPADATQFPKAVLEQLMKGATADLVNRGLRSDIPPTVRVLDARRENQTAVLELSLTDLGKVEGPKQRVAVAQIVFTATALDGIGSVRFLVDGQPTAIPIEQGSAEAGESISRDDFPRFKRVLGSAGSSTSRSTTTTKAPASTTTTASPTTTTRATGTTSTSTRTSTTPTPTTATTTPGSTPPSSSGGPAQTTTTG